MFENVMTLIVFLVIVLIWYYREGYLPKKEDELLYKIKLLHENNHEVRNVFTNFECEQLKSRENHPQSELFKKGFFTKEGILNRNVDVYGIPTFVFYEYQLNDFKESLIKRIKKIESTKAGKKQIKDLINKYN